jgi:hypothetical protein
MHGFGSFVLIKMVYSLREVKKEQYIKEEINFSVNWTFKPSPRCRDYYCIQPPSLSRKDLR